MTSPEANVVRRLFEEMLNQRRFELAHEIFTPDHRLHDPQLQAAPGPRAMIDALEPFARDLGIAIYRLERGRIAETWQVHDTLGLMQQMGVVPSA